ncbi:MAG: Similar to O-demethylpuromycin-O-methyltransferase [uncultured Pyrinomonadaceae bacterium]|uniref:Similar to O-demethylpuromycin-O-methyltransferase n=1 Tax=uncultured Pyrinomonadaceae bacterium TaxID=2283094 RepID=A0A6J4NIH7_9BACT|nr:MAG: Similar to O-demethylpuromycin-O-methyltransferase [uncultured Pyrinomonadaceae bacterium]
MNDNAATMPQEIPPEAILSQMLFGGLMQQSISIAAKFGIADLLGEKPQTAEELAAATETHAPSLYRILRLLASVGIFSETADRKFELTPLAESLRRDAPNSMRDVAIMQGEEWNWRNYGELRHSVKTGETAQGKAHGIPLFEFLTRNPEDEALFSRAMVNLSSSVIPPIVEAYDFSGAGKLVDIAGGHGFLLAAILKANPHLQGVLFDQSTVIDSAVESLKKQDINDRVEFVPGDFFESVPAGADIYTMKHIIHDWNDDECIRILQNIHRAMNEKGKVLIVEMVVPEGNAPSPSKVMDIQMLIATGGKERTEAEYRKLLESSGFNLTRIIPTRSPFSIVEAVKS